MGLNILICGLDYLIYPPLFGMVLLMRVVFVTLVFGSLHLLWNRPRASWIEGMTLPVVVAAIMLAGGVLSLSGATAVHVRYLDGALFTTATAIVILPVGLPWTIAGTAAALGFYVGFSEANPLVAQKEALAFGAFFTLVIGSLIPARHSMILSLQHAFLLTLRSALQGKALEEANTSLSILADTDSLTGLANRRAFEAEAARLWSVPSTPASSLGIVLLDIDHFKRLNDAAGHSAGDACLVTVARVIRDAAPGDAIVARYGGEEFICVINQATPALVLKLGEAMRAAVDTRAYPHPGLADGACVSVSVGVSLAVSDRRPEGLGDLIRAADAALYRAKAGGRNRCVPAWAVPSEPVPEADLLKA